jgi:deazaflavin-dependent oxidoreductase (nitroreductase family)
MPPLTNPAPGAASAARLGRGRREGAGSGGGDLPAATPRRDAPPHRRTFRAWGRGRPSGSLRITFGTAARAGPMGRGSEREPAAAQAPARRRPRRDGLTHEKPGSLSLKQADLPYRSSEPTSLGPATKTWPLSTPAFDPALVAFDGRAGGVVFPPHERLSVRDRTRYPYSRRGAALRVDCDRARSTDHSMVPWEADERHRNDSPGEHLPVDSRGAKSGETRTVPLLAASIGDAFVLIASNGGASKHPAWYWNLKKTPDCELEIHGVRSRRRAREVSGEERHRLWEAAVAKYPGYGNYAARAGRIIPVMILDPA